MKANKKHKSNPPNHSCIKIIPHPTTMKLKFKYMILKIKNPAKSYIKTTHKSIPTVRHISPLMQYNKHIYLKNGLIPQKKSHNNLFSQKHTNVNKKKCFFPYLKT